MEHNEACDKRCVPIKTYSPSNEEGGITSIYKLTVKLNSPRLACHDDAVRASAAECINPCTNTHLPSSALKIHSNALMISISFRVCGGWGGRIRRGVTAADPPTTERV